MDTFLRKLFLLLLLSIFVLIALHYLTKNLHDVIASSVNLDFEINIPTWFSSILLFSVLISSLLIYLIGKKLFGNKQRCHWFWLCFAIVYCYLSLDETAVMHERMDNLLSIKWVYLYAPFAAIFFFLCCFFFMIIRSDDKSLRNWVLGGLIIYAVGGMGLETLSYIFRPVPDFIHHTEIAAEEGLEMIGTVVVLMGCLIELKKMFTNMNIQEFNA